MLFCVLFKARAKLRHQSAAVQVPIGLEEEFEGLVDLVELKALKFEGGSGYVPVLHKHLVVRVIGIWNLG